MTDVIEASVEVGAVVNSSQRFRNQVSLHSSAAVGVMFLRTSEPFDAVLALREHCQAEVTEYREWSVLHGWQRFDLSEAETPAIGTEPIFDLLPALVAITAPGVNNESVAVGEQMFPAKCLYTMMWPHPYMKAIPQSLAAIAEMSVQLPYTAKRLMMIVPPEFELPADIAQMVPIIDYDLPDQSELRTCYEEVLSDLSEGVARYVKDFDDTEIASICAAGAGMTRREFITAACLAFVSAKREQVSSAAFIRDVVMRTKVEVVKRSQVLEVMPAVTMDEVGGLEEYKDWIARRTSVFNDPEGAAEAGVAAPKGVALIGPPGTAKSLLGKATGAALGIPIIKMDVSRVFGSLVGESEGRVDSALRMLDAMAPCVAFVDEVDKAFDMNSGGGDGGTGKRVLGKILTHMQESDKPIFWIVTANRAEGLPPELLRKGRLDEIFAVSTPSETERREIFRIHMAKSKLDISTLKNLQGVLDASNGYVGAEIEAAIKDAALKAYTDGSSVSAAALIASLNTMKPLSQAFAEQFASMAAWAENNARPASRATTTRKRQRPRKTAPRSRQVASGGGVDDDMAG